MPRLTVVIRRLHSRLPSASSYTCAQAFTETRAERVPKLIPESRCLRRIRSRVQRSNCFACARTVELGLDVRRQRRGLHSVLLNACLLVDPRLVGFGHLIGQIARGLVLRLGQIVRIAGGVLPASLRGKVWAGRGRLCDSEQEIFWIVLPPNLFPRRSDEVARNFLPSVVSSY